MEIRKLVLSVLLFAVFSTSFSMKDWEGWELIDLPKSQEKRKDIYQKKRDKPIDFNAFIGRINKWEKNVVLKKLKDYHSRYRELALVRFDVATKSNELIRMKSKLEKLFRDVKALLGGMGGELIFTDIYDSSTYTVNGIQGVLMSLLRMMDKKAIEETLQKNTERLKGIEWYDIYEWLGFKKGVIPSYNEAKKRLLNLRKKFREKNNKDGLDAARQFGFWLTNQVDKEVVDTFIAIKKVYDDKAKKKLYQKIKLSGNTVTAIMKLYSKFVSGQDSIKMQLNELESYIKNLLEKVELALDPTREKGWVVEEKIFEESRMIPLTKKEKNIFSQKKKLLNSIDERMKKLSRKLISALKKVYKRNKKKLSWLLFFFQEIDSGEFELEKDEIELKGILKEKFLSNLHDVAKQWIRVTKIEKNILQKMGDFCDRIGILAFRGLEKVPLSEIPPFLKQGLKTIKENKQTIMAKVYLSIIEAVFNIIKKPLDALLLKKSTSLGLHKMIKDISKEIKQYKKSFKKK